MQIAGNILTVPVKVFHRKHLAHPNKGGQGTIDNIHQAKVNIHLISETAGKSPGTEKVHHKQGAPIGPDMEVHNRNLTHTTWALQWGPK